MTPEPRKPGDGWRFGRDEDGDRWLGPFLVRPVERRDNHGDRSTTTTLTLWRVRRWHLTVEFTKSWDSDR